MRLWLGDPGLVESQITELQIAGSQITKRLLANGELQTQLLVVARLNASRGCMGCGDGVTPIIPDVW